MSILQENTNSQLAERVTSKKIVISISKQTLELHVKNLDQIDFQSNVGSNEFEVIRSFSVSTAKNGIGNLEGTGCTPLGEHVIANKIGTSMPINSVFVGRMPTGEIYSEKLAKDNPDRDWILTRILWLKGCQEGINKGSNENGCCDTYQRYIYIHGTPDSEEMGVPLSHGCVRMRNEDLVWLFDEVEEGTPVSIIRE